MVQFFAIKIKDPVDLPDQMIRRHHLVEIERVEKLTLSASRRPIIDRSRKSHPDLRNHGFNAVPTRVLQHNQVQSRRTPNRSNRPE